MLQTREDESEIVLGNKQLAGIFLVVAVLLGISFTAGYVVRGNVNAKKALQADTEATSAPLGPAPEETNTALGVTRGGQTHTVGSDENPLARTEPPRDAQASQAADEPPLGARRKKETADVKNKMSSRSSDTRKQQIISDEAAGTYTPRRGSRYLQVAAVSRDEAETVADVLHKKGFKAHAVAKPGSTKIFRVIIGPVRDAGELSSTREALRKTGFREVIVQNY